MILGLLHIWWFYRAAEILYTYANAQSKLDGITSFQAESLVGMLTNARRQLGLFQHHDGITGTAKDHVVVDYGNRSEGIFHML